MYTHTHKYIMTIAVRAPPEISVTYHTKKFFLCIHTHTYMYAYICINIYKLT